jgi:hypothetical protein
MSKSKINPALVEALGPATAGAVDALIERLAALEQAHEALARTIYGSPDLAGVAKPEKGLVAEVDTLKERFNNATTVATLESAAPVTEAELAAVKASGAPPAVYNAMVRKFNAQIARINAELSAKQP